MIVALTDKPITIGRGREADVMLDDEKVSRVHCGVALRNGNYYLKDLKSRNGTHLNGEEVEEAQLNPGDHIRVGSTVITFDAARRAGTQTIIRETEKEMSAGKGYSTILREIVSDINGPPPKNPKTERIRKTPS